MVQFLLTRASGGAACQTLRIGLALALLAAPAQAAKIHKAAPDPAPPDLLLEGGRRLSYERSLRSERDVRRKPGFWAKLANFIAGEAEVHGLVRPYAIAVDSRGRAIVTDPGARGVHIFDLAQNKYKFLERFEKGKNSMRSPQCVAVDTEDNIYVTDSEEGKIFVFDANGKFRRVLGAARDGEGYFKRPTGIAVDSAAQLVYVTDTLRHKIYVLDFAGRVVKSFGQRGVGKGEFNYPTDLLVLEQELAVVDAMNFRVQILDRNGAFRSTLGGIGDSNGNMFRPKGIGRDSEGHFYTADGLWGVVQVFDREGRLLYYFGKRGIAAGDFQLPTSLSIDRNDRVFVVDSYNRRIQIFHYFGLRSEGATK